ncbi:transcription factor SUM-1 [Nephila pilipes]|uniref:Transcription factor SUM-1 n=1 Tax=Nephila pilipes TaxID=299642 RepID=A0A8X6Q314_NEPPI|nr:transcription factor SUM-1 [Nephila pilipes]
MMVPEMRSCRYQKTPPPTTTPPFVTSTTQRGHYDSSFNNQDYTRTGNDFHCQYSSGRFYGGTDDGTFQQQRSVDQHYTMNAVLRSNDINGNYGYERNVEVGLRCQSSEVSTSSEDSR